MTTTRRSGHSDLAPRLPLPAWKNRVLAIAGGAIVAALVGVGLTMPAAAAHSKHHSKAHTVTAAPVYKEFAKAGLPVSGLIVYTAATDPNHLLGRPNGYTSKCAWVDSRVPTSDTSGDPAGDVDFGGSVEVFPTAAGAKARAKEILTDEKAEPILGSEYDYLAGGVLVRISQYLTPTQAASYGKAEKAKLYKG